MPRQRVPTAAQNGYCRRPAASDKGVVYLELRGFVYAERIVREEQKRAKESVSNITWATGRHLCN